MALRYTKIPSNYSPNLTCCQKACPAGTDVSSYISLVAQGRFSEAIAIVREENPFPGICGRVCEHVCETHCRRGESDEPVAIRAIKRFISDWERGQSNIFPEPIRPAKTKKVAIIGSGPAGLTAASDLVRNGFPVTVFEAMSVAGGMMKVGIPDYRLPAEILDFEIEYLKKLGVNINLNSALGRDFTLHDLRQQGFEAALLATGAHGSRELNIPGSDLPGVLKGIDFLRAVKLDGPISINGKVVVIGGGDVAMDVARTALRLGADSVSLFCLESEGEMPAHDWEVTEAADEAISIYPGWGPVEICGEGQTESISFRKCVAVFDNDGRFAPRFDDNTVMSVPADVVITAIGQTAVFAHRPEDGINVTAQQLYEVNQDTMQTAQEWIFAAGDAVHGTQTVIKAVASGHKAAASIMEYLEGRQVTGKWTPVLRPQRVDQNEVPDDWEERPANKEKQKPAHQRARSFEEVNLGLTSGEAVSEAERCMRCDAETRSYTYSRQARERIYRLARDIGRNEQETLLFLQSKLNAGSESKEIKKKLPSFDDLVFLPANLTRLVIDPYREACATHTVIGAGANNPMKMDVPIILGVTAADAETFLSFQKAANLSGTGFRVKTDASLDCGNCPVVLVEMNQLLPETIHKASALEIHLATTADTHEPEALAAFVERCRMAATGVPVGLFITPGSVQENIRLAVNIGLDFVTLSGIPSDTSELDGHPQIEVLAEAIETLREMNREEDISIIYTGGIKSGADLARAICLGANAVVIESAPLIAANTGIEDETDTPEIRISRLITAFTKEAAMLACCCGKTNVHNLEPEDLRSLTVETSAATGVPLAGSDQIYRATQRGNINSANNLEQKATAALAATDNTNQ